LHTANFPNEPVIVGGDLNIDMEHQPGDYQNMLAALNASFVNAPRPPGVPSNPASLLYRWTVDPTTNQISSARGASQEWLDYIVTSRVQPTAASYRAIDYQAPAPFLMSVQNNGSLLFSIQTNFYWDLSDHSALWGNLIYPSAPLGPGTGDTMDGVFSAIREGPVEPIAGAQIRFDGNTLTLPVTIPLQIGRNYEVEALTSPAVDGARYIFHRWKDGQPQPFTLVGPPANSSYVAVYRRQFELVATAVPSNGGTINGSGWYAPTDSLDLTPSAAPVHSNIGTVRVCRAAIGPRPRPASRPDPVAQHRPVSGQRSPAGQHQRDPGPQRQRDGFSTGASVASCL